jgi:hypothetical protein
MLIEPPDRPSPFKLVKGVITPPPVRSYHDVGRGSTRVARGTSSDANERGDRVRQFRAPSPAKSQESFSCHFSCSPQRYKGRDKRYIHGEDVWQGILWERFPPQ